MKPKEVKDIIYTEGDLVENATKIRYALNRLVPLRHKLDKKVDGYTFYRLREKKSVSSANASDDVDSIKSVQSDRSDPIIIHEIPW